MTFKKNIVLRIVMVCLSVAMVVSCKSHEQKTDDAFEQVKEKKRQTNDSDKINNAMLSDKRKILPVKSKVGTIEKNTLSNEQGQFKIETIRKIQTNQNKITEMKSLPDAGFDKKMISLEKANNDLIIKMDEYNKNEKLKWELFKAEMNQQVNEIGIELKAIKINTKK